MSKPESLPGEAHNSTASIISYVVLGIFSLTNCGVFALITLGVTVEPVMLTVLGSMLTAVTAALTAVIGFWMGSSSGAKTSNAALAQLAGAGAPPPAAPGSGTPTETPVDDPPTAAGPVTIPRTIP